MCEGDFLTSQWPFQPSQYDKIEQERPRAESNQKRSARKPRGHSGESCRRSPGVINAEISTAGPIARQSPEI
eukprot:4707315-Pyramimonas_sp.AAC.1